MNAFVPSDPLQGQGVGAGPDMLGWVRMEAFAITLLVLILIMHWLVWLPQWWQAGENAENDFTFYYLAGWRLRLGLSPYEDLLSVKDLAGLPLSFGWGSDTDFPPVGNPPSLLYLLLPFTFLPYRGAWFLWNVISVLALGLALLMLWRAFPLSLSLNQRIIGVLLILIFPPLAYHLRWGRSECLVLLALAGSLIAIQRGREAWAGALAGLAACLRLYPGLFLLYFVVTRRWRSSAAMAGTAFLLSVACLIPRGMVDYQMLFVQALPTLSSRFLVATASFSLPSVLARLQAVGISPPAFALYGLQALLILIALSACYMAPNQPALGYGLMVITALLFSPITWYHSFILLAIPMLASIPLALAMPGWRLALGLIYMACCCALVVRLPWPALSVLASIWPFYGLVGLYAHFVMLLRHPSHIRSWAELRCPSPTA